MLLLPDLILLGKGFRNFLLQNFTTSTEKFSHLQLLFIADNFFNQTKNIRFEAMFFGARSGGPETFFSSHEVTLSTAHLMTSKMMTLYIFQGFFNFFSNLTLL